MQRARAHTAATLRPTARFTGRPTRAQPTPIPAASPPPRGCGGRGTARGRPARGDCGAQGGGWAVGKRRTLAALRQCSLPDPSPKVWEHRPTEQSSHGGRLATARVFIVRESSFHLGGYVYGVYNALSYVGSPVLKRESLYQRGWL